MLWHVNFLSYRIPKTCDWIYAVRIRCNEILKTFSYPFSLSLYQQFVMPYFHIFAIIVVVVVKFKRKPIHPSFYPWFKTAAATTTASWVMVMVVTWGRKKKWFIIITAHSLASSQSYATLCSNLSFTTTETKLMKNLLLSLKVTLIEHVSMIAIFSKSSQNNI